MKKSDTLLKMTPTATLRILSMTEPIHPGIHSDEPTPLQNKIDKTQDRDIDEIKTSLTKAIDNLNTHQVACASVNAAVNQRLAQLTWMTGLLTTAIVAALIKVLFY